MIETNFKHTDIGLIPHDWEVKSLDSLFAFYAGGDIQKEYFSMTPQENKRYPIYSNSLENKGLYGYTSHPRYEANSITITGRGSLGHAEFRNHKFDAIVRLLVLQPKELVSGEFVTNTINFYMPFVFESTGVPQLTVPQTAKALIPLPPTLAEQEKIANALSKIDQLINNLGALIEKKKAIKQGTMQDLLTAKRRLKGFTGEWKSVKIGDIGNTYNGLFGKTASDFGKGEANYITFLNILCNPIIDTTIFEKVQVHPNERQNAVHKGDLFFNTSSETPEEVGICSVILDEIENLYINSFCFGFRILDETIDGKYLAYYFRCKEGRDLMTTLAQGATRYNLSKLSFSQANVILPPTLAEQRAIANVLSSMDTEITNLEQKRDKYIAIKQGMMQNLLTGKIRLI